MTGLDLVNYVFMTVATIYFVLRAARTLWIRSLPSGATLMTTWGPRHVLFLSCLYVGMSVSALWLTLTLWFGK